MREWAKEEVTWLKSIIVAEELTQKWQQVSKSFVLNCQVLPWVKKLKKAILFEAYHLYHLAMVSPPDWLPRNLSMSKFLTSAINGSFYEEFHSTCSLIALLALRI